MFDSIKSIIEEIEMDPLNVFETLDLFIIVNVGYYVILLYLQKE